MKTEVREAVEATAKDGILLPKGVVDAARRKSSVLHAEFERRLPGVWDDRIAAEASRLAIGRALIREIHYTVKDVTKPPYHVHVYVHKPGSKPGFIAVSAAARNREEAEEIFKEELTRATAAIRRAQDIAGQLGGGLLEKLNAILSDLLNLST